jgi:hypothetical protein
MKYQVNITATEYYAVMVEAEDENQAERIARRQFEEGKVQTEWPDYDVDFEVEELS